MVSPIGAAISIEGRRGIPLELVGEFRRSAPRRPSTLSESVCSCCASERWPAATLPNPRHIRPGLSARTRSTSSWSANQEKVDDGGNDGQDRRSDSDPATKRSIA
jgi:hypothetical protein